VWHGNSTDKFASVFTFLSVIVLLGFPVGVWTFLWRKMSSLEEENMKKLFGSTYEELRTNSRAALLFNVVYMVRRLFFAAVTVYLNEWPSIQVILVIFHCLVVLMYLMSVRPFVDPLMNRMEIMNEIFIMAAAYHMLIFTDFLPNPNL